MTDPNESLGRPAFFPRRHGPLPLPDPFNQMIVPRPARTRAGTVLTERDRAILDALRRNRVLTVELVEWAFFPPRGGTRAGPSSRAYARIARLHAEGYIAELRLPASPGGGSLPRLLVIDRRGIEAITDRESPPDPDRAVPGVDWHISATRSR